MNREEIIELARQTGFERLGHDDDDYVCYPEEIVAFAKQVADKEREACAKECEGINSAEDYYGERPELICAEAIRARGQE